MSSFAYHSESTEIFKFKIDRLNSGTYTFNVDVRGGDKFTLFLGVDQKNDLLIALQDCLSKELGTLDDLRASLG